MNKQPNICSLPMLQLTGSRRAMHISGYHLKDILPMFPSLNLCCLKHVTFWWEFLFLPTWRDVFICTEGGRMRTQQKVNATHSTSSTLNCSQWPFAMRSFSTTHLHPPLALHADPQKIDQRNTDTHGHRHARKHTHAKKCNIKSRRTFRCSQTWSYLDMHRWVYTYTATDYKCIQILNKQKKIIYLYICK